MMRLKNIPCRCPWCRLAPDTSLHRIHKLLYEPHTPMSAEGQKMLQEIVAKALKAVESAQNGGADG